MQWIDVYIVCSYLLTDSDLRAAWYAVGGIGFVIVGMVVVGVAHWYISQKKRRPLSHTQAAATTPPTARPATATAQTTFTAAPTTLPVEQYYPAEFKAGLQEAPPPYPAHDYPTYSPVPQVL